MSEPEVDSEPQSLTTKYTHLSAGDIRLLLELHDAGKTQVEIAGIIGCAQATVSRTLKAFNADSKAVARQLRAYTDEAIDDWRTAKRVASTRGDHRPAREMLEAAYPELRPTPASSTGGGGVTVIVAVPGSDNRLPVIDAQRLSPSVTTDLHKLSGDK